MVCVQVLDSRMRVFFIDTITRMHPNIKILVSVLDELAIPYKTIESFPDALEVGQRYFVRSGTPYNSESLALFCRDKDAVHKILSGVVLMPKTKSFLNPEGRYNNLSKAKSIRDIVEMTLDFVYPRIVKMNHGEQGRNVFLVTSQIEMEYALHEIFDQKSRYYDYIALVQEYIQPQREVRVLISGGEAMFVYERDSKREVLGADKTTLQNLTSSILEKIPLSWGACDFIQSRDGQWYFLEINTRPKFGEDTVVLHKRALQNLYKRALQNIL